VVMGYGVIESENDEITLVDFGAITVRQRDEMAKRLHQLYNELLDIILRHRPDAVAVETPFVSKNVKSAMAIGRAQAIALLAAAGKGIPTYEYAPAKVKQQVAHYGASSKEQVQEMVRLQLGMAEVPRPNDAADALAVALCHVQEMHLKDILAGNREEQ